MTKAIRKLAFLGHLFCLVGGPVVAAPIPLVEFTYEKGPKFGGVGAPPQRNWEFGFSASLSPDGNPALFEWFDMYSVDDVGQSFQAPAPVVNGAAEALASPSTLYLMFTAGLSDPSAPGRLIDWTNVSTCNPCAQILVSDTTAYRVTVVERVINDLTVADTGSGTWVIGGKQTVRFLGEPIPEPRTIALLVAAFGCCSTLLFTRPRYSQVLAYSTPA